MNAAADTGFADPGAARTVLRRLKLRRQLREVAALVPALLDRLDQQFEADGGASPAAGGCGCDLFGCDLEGGVGRLAVDLIEGKDMREQQLLQGVDLVLQLLNALLGELGHGRFSNCFDTPSATPEAPGRAPSM